MKYIVILGDGMADYPIPELGGMTPLQVARKPAFDYMAKNGQLGMVRTIPEDAILPGGTPGSDQANLSVLGYDIRSCYTGRSPIEADGMGISLSPTDVAVRCNFVTLSGDEPYEAKTMLDYSADEISTPEAAQLIECLQRQLGGNGIAFHPGVSYRHCVVWGNGRTNMSLTPPHDIADKPIAPYLPRDPLILSLMRESCAVMQSHPVNAARAARGLNPANAIWLWGEGTKLTIPPFFDKYRKRGAVISAVDLLKGIAVNAGLEVITVPGATGNIHTNFTGKKDAAIAALQNGNDFVYIHVEAPDECGHRYEIKEKVRAIELIDEKIAAPLLDELKRFGLHRILVLPDHPTPLSLRTHTPEPVPFILYDSGCGFNSEASGYDERQAQGTGLYIDKGYTLMDRLFAY